MTLDHLVREEKCPECGGSGSLVDREKEFPPYDPDCFTCHGTGTVTTSLSDEEVRELLAKVVEINLGNDYTKVARQLDILLREVKVTK
jgi:hypothetical protein